MNDLESGSQAKANFSLTSLLRKWRSLPRFIKIYLPLFLVGTSFLLGLFYYTNRHLNAGSARINYGGGQAISAEQKKHEALIRLRPDQARGEELQVQSENDRPESKEQLNDALMQNFKKALQHRDINWERDLKHGMFTKSDKQEAVIEAMRHAWNGYRSYAWGFDHLRPITKKTQTWFGVGLTIVDSLDTLLLMGMEKEYLEAMKWIESDLNFDINKNVNCFEMTIRVLGGLLSAHHLTNSHLLLSRAVDVGSRLIHCFDSRSQAIPFSDVNLKSMIPKAPAWSQESSLSEVSTVQLEFRDLSRTTGDESYEVKSFKASKHIHGLVMESGDSLLPMYINPNTGRFTLSTITLGARGDSYYEYLLKQYLQTGITWLRDDYVKAIKAIRSRLLRTTNGPHKYTFVAELLRSSSAIHPKMDHLVCFLPGTLALGHYHYSKSIGKPNEWPSEFKDHLELAESLARTCYAMYNTTATGLSPEISYFSEEPNDIELQIRPADTHNLLRPEYVESLFYLYHITDDEMYREQGWKILQAFNKYCKVSSGGYTSISDVRNPSHTRPKDMQESFFLAETLKYLYLLFSDDKPMVYKLLNYFVINTEGHVLPTNVEV